MYVYVCMYVCMYVCICIIYIYIYIYIYNIYIIDGVFATRMRLFQRFCALRTLYLHSLQFWALGLAASMGGRLQSLWVSGLVPIRV